MVAVKDVQLSRNTVTRCCGDIVGNIQELLIEAINSCECFSLQIDESTGIIDVAQLCLFVRMVFEDMSAKEETRDFASKGACMGRGHFSSLHGVTGQNQSVCICVSVSTDVAPAMVGLATDLIALCKKHNAFPVFIQYLYIMHQQSLVRVWTRMMWLMSAWFWILSVPEAFSGGYFTPDGRAWSRAHWVAAAYWCQMAEQRQVSGKSFHTKWKISSGRVKMLCTPRTVAHGLSHWLDRKSSWTKFRVTRKKTKTIIDKISSVNPFKCRLQLFWTHF